VTQLEAVLCAGSTVVFQGAGFCHTIERNSRTDFCY